MDFNEDSEWDPYFEPYVFDWETFDRDDRFYPERNENEKETKIYTPFKSLEQLEKDVKAINKELNN